jgi:hypothetical protein
MSLSGRKNDPPQSQPDKLERLEKELKRLGAQMGRMREALGRIEGRQTKAAQSLQEAEFRVFSQWGEDGIIQYLLGKLSIPRKVFVEFGVETYVEANTRFLLMNDNWSGLVLDGSAENIRTIRKSAIYWQYNLKAVEAFITRENINTLLTDNGMSGEIGLLSVDIDGNDYWVWQATDAVFPAIVVLEYNARFGPDEAVTVPYDPGFTRGKAHHSHIYYGASLAALTQLSAEKGYALVGCNRAGNNAFYVRDDLLPDGLPKLSVKEAYTRNQFRESRDAEGKLALLSFEEEQKLVFSLPLQHV